jgi:hypothetical protein
MLGLGLSLTTRAVLGAGGFSPASLFAAGEVGAWYDPSDLTTLFQDDAGTTPVTEAGQRVGRMLDKSGRGNHATQSVLAQRPTYAVEPVTGRRNRLTYTEDFSNAIWNKANITATGGATAPDGTATAFTLTATDSNTVFSWLGADLPTDTAANISLWLRRKTGTALVTLRNGLADTIAVPVTSSWAQFSYAVTTKANADFTLRLNALGDEVELWHPQLELGSTATAYQRVVTAQDVSEAGVAARPYLFFDGIDDGMLTGTITPGADKAQVFAGVQKLSDVARGTVAELTASAAANNGAFHLTAPNAASDTFAFESKGTALTDAVASGIAAPASRVLAGLGDIAGDTATLRVNGVQADQDTGDQGTGNYAAAVLYLGRRGGTTLPFSGHIYGLIVRFSAANLAAASIAATERWMNSKTGAF